MSGKTLKYVRHSVAGFMVWPKNWDEVHHAHVGRLLAANRNLEDGQILSAGFIDWAAPCQPVCHGKSESLGIASKPEDTAALRAEWGICDPVPQDQAHAAAPVQIQSTTAEHVRRVIADNASCSLEQAADDKDLTNDLGLDSMDRYELTLDLEEEFDILIMDHESAPLNTVGEIVALVESKVKP